MAKEYMNIKIKDVKKGGPKRMQPRILHLLICKILEEALDENSGIETVGDGFVSKVTLETLLIERQQNMVGEARKSFYTTDYNAADLINKGINPKIKDMGREVLRKRLGKHACYKGYHGLTDDYNYSITMNRELPVDKGVFEFIKGTMDYNTMSAIRSRISFVADRAWQEFKRENPKYDTSTVKEKEVKAMYKPHAPFICIEGSVYEFTPDYNVKVQRERELLLKFADAIINRKAVKVSYQALHYDKPDDLEFHTHYIRKVGNKLMIYGRSRSIAYHQPDQYTLVNLIVQRVVDVTDLDEEKHYYSAEELGLDYNNEVFLNRITFDAPGFLLDYDTCTEVILRVIKKIETTGNPRMPFQRILSEPLHHSQKVLEDRGDEQYGYISIHVKDYMRMKPILLKWGSDVTVESPLELRQIMEDEVRRMATAYGLL